jgi:hypothetical protein
MIQGASSDKEALGKIMRELKRGYVLYNITYCTEKCPVPVHLHFRRES